MLLAAVRGCDLGVPGGGFVYFPSAGAAAFDQGAAKPRAPRAPAGWPTAKIAWFNLNQISDGWTPSSPLLLLLVSLGMVSPWAWYLPGPGISLGMVSPWACYLPGHGISLGMVSPWAWYCPGHGISLGMVSPWAWYLPGPGIALGLVSPWAWYLPGHGISLGMVSPWAWYLLRGMQAEGSERGTASGPPGLHEDGWQIDVEHP
ncbi:hypothetical protein NHX12_027414 [Muraenolepis orangiensis]|uniref:Uncharacterized protein n=1 Tax=Muraenolepis orangiensis TaxID=630683 RepID=A0A9Q0ILV1_9TELE|nr:hypothetical protein NHX12_027414 [Muraenolepis orangiensis]